MTITFEELWGRATRVIGFMVGTGIMVYETIGDHSDRPWLYAAAVGMMGLPIARAAESILGHWSTQGPHRAPNEAAGTKSIDKEIGPNEDASK